MTASDKALLFFGALLPPFIISWLMGFVMRRWAPRIGLVDKPGGHKQHANPTPLGGGVAVWFAVVTTFAIGLLALVIATSNGSAAAWVPGWVRPHLSGLHLRQADLGIVLAGGSALMLLGLLDDRYGLPWQLRLGFEFIVAAICVVTQGDDWQLTAFIGLKPLTWALSILWVVTLVNSFNMLDNMDGLSGGVAAIVALMLAIFLLFPPAAFPQGPQLFVGGFLLVLVGALLGFLWHNKSPARLFLGDAGSYFVGFSIAIASMVATYTTYQSQSKHAILAPICVMAVPLYDLVTVLAIRIREGRNPFHGDRSHFSHRLVELGFSKPAAVLTIYLTTATCGLGAVLLGRVDRVGAVTVVVMVLCILCLIYLIESTARRKNHRDAT